MSAGMMVYHVGLKMNLIVCQVDAKGRIICINPKVFDEERYQTLTVNVNEVVKGWKTIYD